MAPELLAKAAHGPITVIVELRVVAPAGPGEIAALQTTLLESLVGTPHRVVRRFETIPFIALEVSVDALTALAASPHVRGVQEDVRLPLRPAPPRR